jgi:hypothetical protein
MPPEGVLVVLLAAILGLSARASIDGVDHIAFPKSLLTYALTALFALIFYKDAAMSDLSTATFTFSLGPKTIAKKAAPTKEALAADAELAKTGGEGNLEHTCVRAREPSESLGVRAEYVRQRADMVTVDL